MNRDRLTTLSADLKALQDRICAGLEAEELDQLLEDRGREDRAVAGERLRVGDGSRTA